MSAPVQQTAEFLIFQLADEHYALPGAYVRAVARHQPPTPVPGTPPELPGIISHHGTILPVVDPRPLLGLPQPEPTRMSRIVTVVNGEFDLALIADRVADLIALPTAGFSPPPSTLDPIRARLLGGTLTYAGQPLALLDLAALVGLVRDGT